MFNINWYYVATIIIIATGSIPRGYDEGGFAAAITLKSFQKDFGILPADWKNDAAGLADRKSNITSLSVLGAAIGALFSIGLVDRLGRLRSWQLFVLWWATGLFMQIFSSGIYGLMLFARVWSGIGSGGLTVVAPLYLTDIAPAKTRGLVVSIYMIFLLGFLSLGFFINYGVSVTLPSNPSQYRIVLAIPLIPCGLSFIGSFFLSDTPRWLAGQDRVEEALATLSRLRGKDPTDPSLSYEYAEIQEQIQTRRHTLAGVTLWTQAKEVALTPTYRKRFGLAIFMQTVAQWSGGNGITYYIPQIFTYAGVVGSNQSLITSGAYGCVKLVFTVVFAWGLIDYFGRRPCMLWGIGMQCVTHIYMAIYMSTFMGGTNESASNAAIASVFIYAVGWSIGLCTIQYLYVTEMFPTRIRGVVYGTNMCVHWFFQFAVVKVTPNMFVTFDIWGAYVFWASICFIGFVGILVWAPETKQVPMERMDELFAGKWYMGWKAKIDPSETGASNPNAEKDTTQSEIESV